MIFIGSVLSANAANNESRMALIIGQSNYKEVPDLPNTKNDARDIAEALDLIGFKTTLKFDLKKSSFEQTLKTFIAQSEKADVALIYFAGHGIEIDGENFLIPVDAQLNSDRVVPLETISLETILNSLSYNNQMRIVILDACRNNPFTAKMKRSGNSTRNISRGLKPVEPDRNTLVAYAAKAGEIADDGQRGGNSPFASSLIKHLKEPGLEIGLFFRKVRDDVLVSTNKAQEPFVYGSLSSREFYFSPPTVKTPTPPLIDNLDKLKDQAAWSFFEDQNTPSAYKAYLEDFPNGLYRSEALAKLKPKKPNLGETLKPASGNTPQTQKCDTSLKGDCPGPRVNLFLWRSTLETLSFMPLDHVDPFGGIIVTDWYASSEKTFERFKVSAYILDENLRADALKVNIFKQVRKSNIWLDQTPDADTARQIENAILTRARELYIASISSQN